MQYLGNATRTEAVSCDVELKVQSADVFEATCGCSRCVSLHFIRGTAHGMDRVR
jgi:hypothetical protein